jgi:hypothetical protein
VQTLGDGLPVAVAYGRRATSREFHRSAGGRPTTGLCTRVCERVKFIVSSTGSPSSLSHERAAGRAAARCASHAARFQLVSVPPEETQRTWRAVWDVHLRGQRSKLRLEGLAAAEESCTIYNESVSWRGSIWPCKGADPAEQAARPGSDGDQRKRLRKPSRKGLQHCQAASEGDS